MLALVVGSLIVGFLLVCAVAPDPSTTWAVGHVAMVGLLVYLLAREFTRRDPEDAKADRPERRPS